MKAPPKPILPKATAVWLIENTALTFKQIADFCDFHELEVKGMADDEVAHGIRGVSPVENGQLTMEEIKRCVQDPNSRLQISLDVVYDAAHKKSQRVTKYTPIARRQDKPDAICWLLKNYPGVQDHQIIKLIGTTKDTIAALRSRTHWNMKNIRPRDPVLLGICSQTELNNVVAQVESLTEKQHES